MSLHCVWEQSRSQIMNVIDSLANVINSLMGLLAETCRAPALLTGCYQFQRTRALALSGGMPGFLSWVPYVEVS